MPRRTENLIFLGIVIALALIGIRQTLVEDNSSHQTGRAGRQFVHQAATASKSVVEANVPRDGPSAEAPITASTISPFGQAQPVSPVQSLVAPVAARVGDHATVSVNVTSRTIGITAVSFILQYDSAKLRLVSVTCGDVMMQADELATLAYESDLSAHEIHATLTVESGNGVVGAGTVASAEFEAVNEGPATVLLREFDVLDSDGRDVPIGDAPVTQIAIASH